MRKYIIVLSLLAAPLLLPVACDKYPESGPEAVLIAYLDAYYAGRYETSYGHISSLDRSVKNLKTYLAENKKNTNPLAQAFADDMAIKILASDKTGDKATLRTLISLPDIEYMRKAVGNNLSDSADIEQVRKRLARKYKGKEIPTLSKQENFQMLREQGIWKVHLDWQAKIVAREKEERIAALLEEARQLRNSGSLQNAIEKYEQVLELDPAIILAKQGIVDTKREISEYKEKQDYIKNVALYDLKAKFYTIYADHKVPGVEFKLKNNGERLLGEIEVTVYFKDANGKVIAEERYHPVLATKRSSGGDKVILKQNYIWQMENGNFYKADSVPNEWLEGAVAAKVTDIKFAE